MIIVDDVVLTVNGAQQTAYGFQLCALAGQQGKGGANADNYNLFSVAVSLNKFFWALGSQHDLVDAASWLSASPMDTSD